MYVKIAEWFCINKMAVNINMTKFMIFHTKGKIIPLNSVKMRDQVEKGEEREPKPNCYLSSLEILRAFRNLNAHNNDDNENGKNDPNLVYEIERYHSNHENNACTVEHISFQESTLMKISP